ncbi:MAG: hypothetical protein QOF09_4421 [Alphaproteobacteria bacterium]|jgi:hypothetical protein|nr:hypothetical protein [Alphaproteobacteria bacterium]
MLAPFGHSQAPDSADVRAALDRICASRPFDTSPKLSRFLRFVVEVTLSGQGHRLKNYTIGVEALGRAESFNPQIDPIVRVEAIRLRAELVRYYSGAGAHDAVVIDMPRGRYVARFRWAHRSAPRMMWQRACTALQRLLAA